MAVVHQLFTRLPREISDFLGAAQQRLPEGAHIHLVGGAVRDIVAQLLRPARPKAPGRDYDFVVTGLSMDALAPLLDGLCGPVKQAGVHKPMLLVRLPSGLDVEVGALTGDLLADLSARDFSINAMAYSPTLGFSDPFGGMQALSAGRLEALPGDPLRADPARLIRAARFAARFELEPTDALLADLTRHAPLVRSLPGPRLALELSRLLLADDWVASVRMLSDTGVLGALIPQWNRARGLDQCSPYHSETVEAHILSVCAEVQSRSLVLRLAALLHDIGKPDTMQLVVRGGAPRGTFYGHDVVGAQIVRDTLPFLGFSQALVADVATLVERHMTLRHDLSEAKLRALAHALGPSLLPLFAELVYADRAAHVGGVSPVYAARIEALELAFTALPASASGQFCDHDLALSGSEIADLGVSGRQIGEVKRHLVGLVVSGEAVNDRSALLSQAQLFVSGLLRETIA